jgi:hypothetical protein
MTFPSLVLCDLPHVQISQVLSLCYAIPTSLLLSQDSGLVCFFLILLPATLEVNSKMQMLAELVSSESLSPWVTGSCPLSVFTWSSSDLSVSESSHKDRSKIDWNPPNWFPVTLITSSEALSPNIVTVEVLELELQHTNHFGGHKFAL